MISEVINLLSDYGLISMAILISFYIVYYIIKNKFKTIVKTITTSLSSNDTVDFDLKYHPFFYNIEYKLTVEIPNMEISPHTPVKQQLFKDLIYFRIKTIYDACVEISKSDMQSWSKNQWSSEITNKMNKMMLDFNRECHTNGVPDIVVSKFIKWHSPTVDMLYEYVNSLGSSDLYDDNNIKTGTFLIIINLLLVTTIADAERTLKDLNGDIEGKLYKNLPIEH